MYELIYQSSSLESSLLVISLVVAIGLAIGSIAIRGVRIGVAGILFSGLMFAQFGLVLNQTVLGFSREFGLVLFVFATGLSIGPGFFNALYRHGIGLNCLAAGVVGLGVLITVMFISMAGFSVPIAVGLFCGATTNTPSLAAASQALSDRPPGDEEARRALAQVVPDHPLVLLSGTLSEGERKQLLDEVAKLPGMAYAVSYPGGVFGIIAAILLLRWTFKIKPTAEAAELHELHRATSTLEKMHICITNPNLAGITIAHIPAIQDLQVVISRVTRGTEELVATPDVRLATGDVLLAVGKHARLQQLLMILGELAPAHDSTIPSRIHVQWATVTRKQIVGTKVGELALGERLGVQMTRIRRAGVELPPLPDVKLGLGDEVHLVGLPDRVANAAHELGDSIRTLGEPEMMPIFVAIAMGVIVGSIPLTLPNVPGSVKLGLAGGPLVVSILLSRFQRIGPLVWYLPRSANLVLKDLGISLFLASVGLMSGDLFLDAFVSGAGLKWLVAGFVTTVVPLLVIGFVARVVAKQHFLSIVGMLAGSMTDPPALAFANSMSNSEVPSVAYATVYPLTMILRITAAQLLIMYWTG